MLKNKKITIIVSGGIDSVTLLYYALNQTTKDKIKVLSFDYGQKHGKRELMACKKMCREIGVDQKEVNLRSLQGLLDSALTKKTKKIPTGHYTQDNMKQTVVPNRNAILLSIAYGYAISGESNFLLYGCHAGDHPIYPDCRPIFVEALNVALQLGNDGFGTVQLKAPFVNKTKSDIVKLGLELHVPFSQTWSCYRGGEKHCGMCGTCVERILSFHDNNMQDPVVYEQGWDIVLQNAVKLATKYKENIT